MVDNIPDSKSNAPSRLSRSGDMLNPQNGIYIYEYYGFNIEPEAWGYPVNINKPLTQQLANTYILWRTKVYTRNKLQDYQLEILIGGKNNCSTYQIKELVTQQFRNHLLSNGVWVNRRRGLQISKALEQTLLEENPKRWTEEEIDRQIEAFGKFNSRHRKVTDENQRESYQLNQQTKQKFKMKNMDVQMTY
ncbi:hypothetical protein OnM2_095028 [Erysiphe neolycopersici]|uniref:Uncharacterized protein n=1 Tax=Erysiphe neolycopersici TaxID=212602 RepID=A0A420HB78_9PEZI|nr:hypothetical protein OnM2_095028 [Erysiphe neolycopersici]